MDCNRFGFWMVTVVLVLSFGAACSDSTAPGPAPCVADMDCESDEACFEGYCRPQCDTSADCDGAQVCVSGVCLTPCDGDAECPQGEQCQSGYCRPVVDVPDGGDGDGGGGCVDLDNDGYYAPGGGDCPGEADCDDGNRAVNPNATESCANGVDDDCDGQTDEADCGCTYGERTACYTGDPATDGQGLCHAGVAICQQNRTWGECLGEQLPVAEVCDGEDNDCNGEPDEGLLNACGACSPPDAQLVELCANGLDDNCDGQVDESCSCDPDCQCEDPQSGSNCTCHPPVGQPCYSGSPSTLGYGICTGGVHDCEEQPSGDYAWTACAGEVLPAEECAGGQANGLDDDCDGLTDEDCLPDGDGDGYPPPDDCDDTDAAIHPGAQESCNGLDDNCDGIVDEGVSNACGTCGAPPQEECGDAMDNDCDGSVDEGCGGCTGNESRQCYGGPPGTQGTGQCDWGSQTCDGEFWGACEGDVVPDPEVCDGVDNDCDLEVDEQWAIGANPCGYCDGTEICDGLDNDCDGFADEGLVNGCGQCLPVPDETDCNGLDDDCDGLVDEDLLTACGTCPSEACYGEEWDKPGDCIADLRECNGVEPDPADPDAITLGQGAVLAPFIYIAVNTKDEVAKLDTDTGQKVWQVPSHGDDPSRTAVALDFSVWVANRGSGSINDPNFSNGVHLDADGNLLCRVDTPGRTRGVAIDGDGNVWFGTWEGQTVYQVHGQDTNATDCSAPPCCRVMNTVNVGVSIYGLAVDGNGFLWGASGNSHSHTTSNAVRLDTRTGAFDLVSNPSWYGIAISPVDGRIWYGNWWGTGCVHSVLPDPPYTVFNSDVCGGHITGVTVDLDGYVWASSHDLNTLYKIDPGTGAVVCSTPVPMVGPGATDARGVAIDTAGRVWVANRVGGYANRFFTDCTHDQTFEIDHGAGTYTYSDMTGMQLRTVTTREGHWIQNFDSGYAAPIWHSATWEAMVPAGTLVTVSFTSADSLAELQTNPSPVCGPFTQSPADMSGCTGLQGHRWLSADVALSTTQDGVRPSFSNLQVFWSR